MYLPTKVVFFLIRTQNYSIIHPSLESTLHGNLSKEHEKKNLKNLNIFI